MTQTLHTPKSTSCIQFRIFLNFQSQLKSKFVPCQRLHKSYYANAGQDFGCDFFNKIFLLVVPTSLYIFLTEIRNSSLYNWKVFYIFSSEYRASPSKLFTVFKIDNLSEHWELSFWHGSLFQGCVLRTSHSPIWLIKIQ